MAITDPRGLKLNAPSQAAANGLETAIESFYSFRHEPLALLGPVLKEWPDFALAHLVRAFVLLGLGERRFAGAARRSLEEAATGLEGERERALYAAAMDLLEGRPNRAGARFDALLLAEPRDILSLHLGHSVDFNLGNAMNLRNRVARVLPCWSAEDAGYPIVLAMHAFGLEESNEYAAAEQAGLKSLELLPANPWAAHAVVHVMEMQGRIDDGIAHLRGRESDWSVDSPFSYHVWWHLALLMLDQDDAEGVLKLYDAELANPEASFALSKLDASALLWRLELMGVDVGDRWDEVVAFWREGLTREGGFNAFHDLHAALAFAAVGDHDSLDELARLQEAAHEGASDEAYRVLQTVAQPLTWAVRSFAEQRFAEAAEILTQVRDTARSFGGSHAQRDLLTLTLMEAAARAGNSRLANHYLNERLVGKPASPLGWRLKERYAA